MYLCTFWLNYKLNTNIIINIYCSHLPELLVAAFIKRMARLSLIAPPTDIQIMVAFIGNLLIRHPPLKVLIQSDSVSKFECLKIQHILKSL